MSSRPFHAELWPDRSLVIAKMGQVRPHRHGSLALLVGVDGSFVLSRAGETRSVQQAVVPAGQLHSLDCGETNLAVVYLFPTHAAVGELNRAGRIHSTGEAAWLSSLREPLRHVVEGACPSSVFCLLEPTAVVAPAPMDERVRHTIDAFESSLMAQDEGHRLSLSEIEHSVGLSQSRLSHLFQSALGVSPGRYRRWVQMRSVCMRRAQGETLTHAALGAGFADSSHFAHAFVSTFGVAPSRALGDDACLRVHG